MKVLYQSSVYFHFNKKVVVQPFMKGLIQHTSNVGSKSSKKKVKSLVMRRSDNNVDTCLLRPITINLI